jgi:hypothetical protein
MTLKITIFNYKKIKYNEKDKRKYLIIIYKYNK